MKYLLLLTLFVLVPCNAFAARMVLQHAPDTVARQQQFYVDVAVDAEGDSFNAIEGSVGFSSETLSLVRIETGNTIISNFIDAPTVAGDTISFSGIIVGGFDGLIDPFDQSKKFPGKIMRLVFSGKEQGNAMVFANKVSVSANDGSGSISSAAGTRASFAVSEAVAPSMYSSGDSNPPIVSASVVQEPDLFEGKYTLVFNATDKESGIDRVELREGLGAWKTIHSPHLLQDQSRKSILSIRAYDASGNVASITIGAMAPASATAVLIIVTLLAAISILYVIYKKTIHKESSR